MRQCTRAEFVCTLAIDPALLADWVVTFRQYGEVLVEAEKARCKLEGNVLTVNIEPEETLLFDHKDMAEMQLQAVTTGGDPLVSDIYHFEVGECIRKKVLL